MKIKHKRIVSSVLLAATFLTFQNFSVFSGSGEHIAMILNPNTLVFGEDETGHTILSDASSSHVIKTQVLTMGDVEEESSHLTPRIHNFTRLNTDVITFETSLTSDLKKTRSEIRVRGMDVRFSDHSNDQTYFTSFEIYVPSDGIVNTIEKKPGHWNIIWQCAQIGAAVQGVTDSDFWRNTSPPISLQVFNNRLYVKTIHDYRRTRVSDLRLWDRDTTNIRNYSDEDTRARYEVPAVTSPLEYAGYLRRNSWNKVFMRFKLGKSGHYTVWVNGSEIVKKFNQPIGYQLADDPFEAEPKYIDELGNYRIRKRCSSRFGLYQGHERERTNSRSRVLFKNYAIGTDWNAVKFQSN
jgi:hypothetical protein